MYLTLRFMLSQLLSEIDTNANVTRAQQTKKFFKTGPGEYSESDVFIGIDVPTCRALAKKYLDISFDELSILLAKKEHEIRLIALLILVEKYKTMPKEVYAFYAKHIKYVNNWDLVDLTAYKIVGDYLLKRPRDDLYILSKSSNMWYRRIAIVATFAFIREGQFDDTLKLAKIYLNDSEDLMHKATGWMLREVGKKNKHVLLEFLGHYYDQMPPIMRNYAMEKLPSTLKTTIRKQAKILDKKK